MAIYGDISFIWLFSIVFASLSSRSFALLPMKAVTTIKYRLPQLKAISTPLYSIAQVRRKASFLFVRSFSTFSEDFDEIDSDDVNEVETGHKKRWVKQGAVYFVGTPLGNLHDMTPRAREVLRQVDVIVAEDTRTTKTLLKRLHRLDQTHNPKANASEPVRPEQRFISHHLHNQHSSIDDILQLIRDERCSVAVVGDAGTPGICDPGTALAQVLHAHRVPLFAVPGASALVCALSVSGFAATPSLFLGFPPVKGAARTAFFRKMDELVLRDTTIVLFEAPHRLRKTLEDLCRLQTCTCPRQRGVVLCREMTKRHEEILRCDTVQEMLAIVSSRSNMDCVAPIVSDDTDECVATHVGSVKGEFTLVLGPTVRSQDTVSPLESNVCDTRDSGDTIVLDSVSSPEEQRQAVSQRLLHIRKEHPNMKRSEAIKEVCALLGTSRKTVYNVALTMNWD